MFSKYHLVHHNIILALWHNTSEKKQKYIKTIYKLNLAFAD